MGRRSPFGHFPRKKFQDKEALTDTECFVGPPPFKPQTLPTQCLRLLCFLGYGLAMCV